MGCNKPNIDPLALPCIPQTVAQTSGPYTVPHVVGSPPQWVADQDMHAFSQQMQHLQAVAYDTAGSSSDSACMNPPSYSWAEAGDVVQVLFQCFGPTLGLVPDAAAVQVLHTDTFNLSGAAPTPELPVVGCGEDTRDAERRRNGQYVGGHAGD